MDILPGGAAGGRRTGGLKVVRDGVWRVDFEAPRVPGEPRRRISKTVFGSRDDAERVLAKLVDEVGVVGTTRRPPAKGSGRGARPRRSGAISSLSTDRWLVGVEGHVDPVTGVRQRYTQTVRGSREQAEVALARLKLTLDAGDLPTATNARTVRSACDLYLREVRTESQTIRTDRSACHRICATVLPGGAIFGEKPLSKVDWKLVEYVFAKWEQEIQPTTRSRYASALSKVFDHAKRTGWLRTNPVVDARRPKVPTHRPVVPATVEVRDALNAAKETDVAFYAYLLGMATIGCRRSELLAITVADLDLQNAVVTIRSSIADGGPGLGTYRKSTKRDDWRDVPLTAQMVETFESLLAQRRSMLRELGRNRLDTTSYVFSDDPEGRTWLRPDTTSQRWLAVRGESNVTFAMLRRYVATQLLDATNGDYRTVASITGNSEETLRRWYDAGPNIDKKRAVVSMARL